MSVTEHGPICRGEASGSLVVFLGFRFLGGFLCSEGAGTLLTAQATVSVLVELFQGLLAFGRHVGATIRLFRLAELAVAVLVIGAEEATEGLFSSLFGVRLLRRVELTILVGVEAFELAGLFLIWAILGKEARGWVEQG